MRRIRPRATAKTVAIVAVAIALSGVAGAVWGQTGKFVPTDTDQRISFGSSLAVDGERVAVGARRDTPRGDTKTGSAYVFTRVDGSWTETAKLVPDQAPEGANFGTSIDLEGTTIAVGANARITPPQNPEPGAVYVFVDEGGWTQAARIEPSDGIPRDAFGTSVDLEGARVIVGAPRATSPDGVQSGLAHIFAGSGSSWSRAARLVPQEPNKDDLFGISVAMQDDLAVVGTAGDDTDAGTDSGSVSVFRRGPGGWSVRSILTPTSPADGDRFGQTVALQGDRLAVGASGDAPAGAVIVYVQEAGSWVREATLRPPEAGSEAQFGNALHLGPDRLLVGAPAQDTGARASGAVHLFTRSDGTWNHTARLDARVPASPAQLGNSVAGAGDQVLGGAPIAPGEEGRRTGAVHVFGPDATPPDDDNGGGGDGNPLPTVGLVATAVAVVAAAWIARRR